MGVAILLPGECITSHIPYRQKTDYSSRAGDTCGLWENPAFLLSLHSSCRTNNIAMVGELKGRFSSLHDKVGFHPAQSEILFQGLQNLPYLPSFHSAFRQQRGWGCCRAQACTQTTLTFWPLEEERWGWREPTFPLDPKPFCLLNMGMKAEQAP